MMGWQVSKQCNSELMCFNNVIIRNQIPTIDGGGLIYWKCNLVEISSK